MAASLAVDNDALASLCRRHHIRRLSLFGSSLEKGPDQARDLDLLVEFEPGHVPGLGFFRIEEEMSTLFGRPVDLNTAGFLSPYFRDRVEEEAEVLYEAS